MVVIDRGVLHKGLLSSRQALFRPTPDPLRGIFTSNGLRLVQEGYLVVWEDLSLVSSNGTGGEFSVDGSDLYSVVSSTSSENVELKLNEKSLGVKYGNSSLRIPFIATFGEIPDIPTIVSSVSLPSDFMAALSEAPKFLSRTEDKPSLSCVYIKHEENVVMLFATNGIVMFFASFDVEETADTEYLLPVQTVASISKVFGRKDVRLGVSDKGHIYISDGSTAITTPGFNGAYPVRALELMRDEDSPLFTVDKKELVGLLKLGMDVSEGERVAISHERRGQSSTINLTFHETRLEADLCLDSAEDTSPFEQFHLNPRFLLTCLAPLGEQVMFRKNSIGAIRISDGKTVSLLHKLLVY